MSHTCHAIDCHTPVPARLLMCAAHWRLVSSLVKADVYAAYRNGQERDKQPSEAYLKAAATAVIEVAHREGVPIPSIWYQMAEKTHQQGTHYANDY